MDPVSELVKTLEKERETRAAGEGDALDEAAELILHREKTRVKNLLDSEEMAVFRQQYVEGRVESSILKQVLDLVGPILVSLLTR
jgi:hypothetical protein